MNNIYFSERGPGKAPLCAVRAFKDLGTDEYEIIIVTIIIINIILLLLLLLLMIMIFIHILIIT